MNRVSKLASKGPNSLKIASAMQAMSRPGWTMAAVVDAVEPTPCEGCDQVVVLLKPYRVTRHDGTVSERVLYCDDCAELAAMDWNGETAKIEEIK